MALMAMTGCPAGDAVQGRDVAEAGDSAGTADADVAPEVGGDVDVGPEVGVDVDADAPSDGDDADAHGTPILQRAPAATFHDCSAIAVPGFATPDGAYHLAYAETSNGMFLVTAAQTYEGDASRNRLVVRPAAKDHTFGAPIFESAAVGFTIGALDAVEGVGDLAFAWQPWLNTTAMNFARVAPNGAVSVAPKEIAGTLGATQKLRLLRALHPGDGASAVAFFVVWQTYAPDGWTPTLKFLALDAGGDPVSDAATLVAPEDAGEGDFRFDARATDGGVVVVWERAADTREIRLARFDPSGQRVGDITTLSPPETLGAYPTLAPRRNGWLVAWTGAVSIMLAKVDTDGRLEGAPVPLGPGPEAGTPARMTGQPVLVPSGDVMALAWAMADDAPIAGEGNSPLEFVLLDPEALAPASQVMTVSHPGDGRLTRVHVVADGLRFLTAYGIAFHAGSGDGAVDFDCPLR